MRIRDLKHTFGRRLGAADVSFEDRPDLLGHKSGRITTHYSAAEVEVENLLEAANKVCAVQSRKSPALGLLKQKALSAFAVSASHTHDLLGYRTAPRRLTRRFVSRTSYTMLWAA